MEKIKLLAFLLLEEEEEDDILIKTLLTQKNKRQYINLYKTRTEEGCFNILFHRHLKSDDVKFREYFRLNRDQFYFILNILKKDLTKIGTNVIKYPISAAEKLAITMRYMATGESFRSLSFAFRISHSYISILIKETLDAMRRHLIPMFMSPPTRESLKQNSNEFWVKWNFPHCTMAVDGKHIRILCPRNSGSLFFNYKDYFSIVLLAMVGANYNKFVAVDVGSYGKEGDSGIFAKSTIGKLVYSGSIFPPDEELEGLGKIMPYVIVGDEAFRLHKHVIKPYTKAAAALDKKKAIFNYRLSRARRVSENAFGILCQVFRVFYTPVALKPETCENLILAACCLHNFLRSSYLEVNGKPFYEYDTKETQSSCMVSLKKGGGFACQDGFQVREDFSMFFSQTGAVPWQDKHISRLTSK